MVKENGAHVNVHVDELHDKDDSSALKSGAGYLWEEAYKRSWDVLEEDADGTLSSVIASLNALKRRRFGCVGMCVWMCCESMRLLYTTGHSGAMRECFGVV
jgi:hypothetical protein